MRGVYKATTTQRVEHGFSMKSKLSRRVIRALSNCNVHRYAPKTHADQLIFLWRVSTSPNSNRWVETQRYHNFAPRGGA
jgi:hypothetical protein